jgi:Transmembrane secretion effector
VIDCFQSVAHADRVSLRRHRDFLLLWSGETVSEVGSSVGRIALPLLAVTTLAATPWQMGLLTAAETAAFLLVGLPAGVLLDRVRRRPVMIGADVVRCLLFASVPLAAWAGVLTLTQVLVVALLAGVATVLFDVGYQSILPSVVGREHLVEGNGRLESTRAAAETGGPALGGALVQAVGASVAIVSDAMSYLVSAAALLALRSPDRVAPPTGRSVRADMAEGLRFVVAHPLLRPITLCTGTANLFDGVLAAVTVLYLSRGLGLAAGQIGLVLAAASVGGLLGAFTAAAWIRRLGQGRVVLASLLVTAPVVALIAVPGVLPFAIGSTAFGYGAVVYNVAQLSFRQSVCPDHLLGRMNASVRFLVWGTMPLGGLAGGALGSVLGVPATLVVVAVGSAAAPLWLVFSPLRRLRDLPVPA